MKIRIYGTGCTKCTKLYDLTMKVVTENGIDAEVEKITDIVEIMKAGVMNTPGLAIDGRVRMSGRLPSEKELKALLSN